MIAIDRGKFSGRAYTTENLNDGSVRLIAYTTPNGKPGELVTVSKSYYGNNEYTLRVNLPEQAKPDKVVVISHTSANCWRVFKSSMGGADVQNVNTYTEAQKLVESIFKDIG